MTLAEFDGRIIQLDIWKMELRSIRSRLLALPGAEEWMSPLLRSVNERIVETTKEQDRLFKLPKEAIEDWPLEEVPS
jgi:hypothetical protein